MRKEFARRNHQTRVLCSRLDIYGAGFSRCMASHDTTHISLEIVLRAESISLTTSNTKEKGVNRYSTWSSTWS
jgi:hypothetical protein